MTYGNYQTVFRKRTEFDEVFNSRRRLDRAVGDKGKNTNKDGHFHWLNDPNALRRWGKEWHDPRETLAVAVREAIPDDKVRGNQADGHG